MKGSTALEKMKPYIPGKGNGLTRSQAMSANCCLCMGRYVDGRRDCEITDCPSYPWMPYRADATPAEKEELDPVSAPAPVPRMEETTPEGPTAEDPEPLEFF